MNNLLLLTMAGLYKRFREFSFEIPKYLLPFSNRTVLHCVLSCFLKEHKFSDLLLVANKREIRFRPQIISILKEFGFSSDNVIFIDDTEGQAITAIRGIDHCLKNGYEGSVIIHNVDTLLMNRHFSAMYNELSNCDCVVDVFNSNNKQYSYILGSNYEVTEIVEKKPISDIATSGCYMFKKAHIVKKYIQDSTYISEVIANMIKDGLNVRHSIVHTEPDTIVLGTPKEYIFASANLEI